MHVIVERGMYVCTRMHTFDEGLKLIVLDAPLLQADLEWQEQREQKLVALVQSPAGILEHLKGQELDDVVDSLGRNGGLV